MSKGHGRVERAILEALSMQRGNSRTPCSWPRSYDARPLCRLRQGDGSRSLVRISSLPTPPPFGYVPTRSGSKACAAPCAIRASEACVARSDPISSARLLRASRQKAEERLSRQAPHRSRRRPSSGPAGQGRKASQRSILWLRSAREERGGRRAKGAVTNRRSARSQARRSCRPPPPPAHEVLRRSKLLRGRRSGRRAEKNSRPDREWRPKSRRRTRSLSKVWTEAGVLAPARLDLRPPKQRRIGGMLGERTRIPLA